MLVGKLGEKCKTFFVPLFLQLFLSLKLLPNESCFKKAIILKTQVYHRFPKNLSLIPVTGNLASNV